MTEISRLAAAASVVLADLASELALCETWLDHVADLVEDGETDFGIEASIAKLRASDLAMRMTTEAVQMHGGIGMTDDFEIGFFMKRAAALRMLMGDVYYHTNRYATLAGY